MSYVAALFVRKMIDQAPAPLERAALFAQAGIREEDANDPKTLVPEAVYYSLLETLAAAEAPEIGFHMRAAGSMTCADFGAIGLAWKSAPTLRRSFQRLDRYARAFNTSSTFRLVEQDGLCMWTHRRTEPKRQGMFLSTEGTLGTYVALCRESTFAENRPQAIQFSHAEAAGSRAALEAYFRCPVTFGADIDAIVLPVDRLDQPNAVGDESIWQFLTSHIEETLVEHEHEETPERRVVLQIADMLSDGVPPLPSVAGGLGMSARTLQRRLAEHGVTYQNLVNQARLELARSLMEETDYSLAEIAFLTGFSEQSAFSRAFKRWAGQTPGAFRSQSRPSRQVNV